MDPEAVLHCTLRQGTVYKLLNRNIPSPKPHYQIVLNIRPLDSHDLHVAVVTSQVEDLKALLNRPGVDPSTIVFIDPSEYHPPLYLDSGVDCNRVRLLRKEELLERWNERETDHGLPDCPNALLDRIKKGVLISDKVEDEIKAAILDCPVGDVPTRVRSCFGALADRCYPNVENPNVDDGVSV